MLDMLPIALLGRNTLVREGLRHILSENRFNVLVSSDDLAELRSTISDHAGNSIILLIDQSYRAYEEDEILLLRSQGVSTKLVFLVERLDLENLIECFRLGAHGYIVKNVGCESLLGSLQLVALGEKVLPGELVDKLTDFTHPPGPAAGAEALGDTLSTRETEILRCLIVGLPNKVIARRLELSEATVKVHVKGILRKLDVRNRTQAAIYAFNHGLGGSFRTSCSDQQSDSFDYRPEPAQLDNSASPELLVSLNN